MRIISFLIISALVLVGLVCPTTKAEPEICDAETGVCAETEATVDDTVLDEDGKRKIPKNANSEGKPPEVQLGACEDRYPDRCAMFKSQGECANNPGWMIVNCASSCDSCHLLDPKLRCDRKFLNISLDPIYQPGDLDRIFESIEAEFGEHLGVTVVSKSPWIITFDNFMADDEIEALISSVEGQWERSTDTGETNAFGEAGRKLSQSRTSSNAWCRHDCESHPFVRNVMKRIEDVVRIPRGHFESFQVLRYEVGQKYNTHHDMSPRQAELACGPRILTFFLYLSDVEEGGETEFPFLGIKVMPKKGKALLWPSTMNDNMLVRDERTHHAALPVIRGTKFAANSWIHLHDFEIPNLWGCTGAFD